MFELIFSLPQTFQVFVWVSIIWLTSVIAVLFAYYPIRGILFKGIYGDVIKNIERSWVVFLIIATGFVFFYGMKIEFYYSFILFLPWVISIYFIYKASKDFEKISNMLEKEKKPQNQKRQSAKKRR